MGKVVIDTVVVEGSDVDRVGEVPCTLGVAHTRTLLVGPACE